MTRYFHKCVSIFRHTWLKCLCNDDIALLIITEPLRNPHISMFNCIDNIAHVIPMCLCYAILQCQWLSSLDYVSLKLSRMPKAAARKKILIPLVVESTITCTDTIEFSADNNLFNMLWQQAICKAPSSSAELDTTWIRTSDSKQDRRQVNPPITIYEQTMFEILH